MALYFNEKVQYENNIKKINVLKGSHYSCDYTEKYNIGYKSKYSGDLTLFVLKSDKLLDDIIENYEKYIYIDEELKKNKFEECYYFKYYKTIEKIKKYGNNFNSCCREDSEISEWGGWNGDKNIVDGCHKPTMYKFIKDYKLINPMSMIKHFQKLFAV